MNHCTTCFKTLEPGINIGIEIDERECDQCRIDRGYCVPFRTTLEPNNPDPEHKMAKNPLYNDESFLARCEQLRLGVELREEEHGDVSTENYLAAFAVEGIARLNRNLSVIAQNLE